MTAAFDTMQAFARAGLARAIALRARVSSTRMRAFHASAASQWRVAIVGAGPSGFYTAKYLLKGDPAVHVDMIDALPTPFGAFVT